MSESPYNSNNPAGTQDNLPNDSSRAAIINRAQQQTTDGAQTQAAVSAASRRPNGSIVRPNLPIQPPEPVRHSPKNFSYHQPPWTRSILEQQRREFFDTRTNNSREVWNALAIVAESMRQGDLAQAQAIMDAANITCPHGKVARGKGKNRQQEGVYDSRGKLYEIPYWLVTDPADIIEDDGDEKNIEGTEDDEASEDVASNLQAREKGKGRADDIGDEVRVTARLNTARDVTVTIGTKQTILVLRRKIEAQSNIKLRRLIFAGKILDNSQTLEATSWKPGQIMNAFVDESATNEMKQTS